MGTSRRAVTLEHSFAVACIQLFRIWRVSIKKAQMAVLASCVVLDSISSRVSLRETSVTEWPVWRGQSLHAPLVGFLCFILLPPTSTDAQHIRESPKHIVFVIPCSWEHANGKGGGGSRPFEVMSSVRRDRRSQILLRLISWGYYKTPLAFVCCLSDLLRFP